jgi:hypothetical protein
MRMSFENAFGLTLLLISVGLIAGPYVSGEETLASLFHNKLALFGAAALLLFVFYRVAAAINELRAPHQTDGARAPEPKQGETRAADRAQEAGFLPAHQAEAGQKETLNLDGDRVIAANADALQSKKAS